jgi:hypothetical protein
MLSVLSLYNVGPRSLNTVAVPYFCGTFTGQQKCREVTFVLSQTFAVVISGTPLFTVSLGTVALDIKLRKILNEGNLRLNLLTYDN